MTLTCPNCGSRNVEEQLLYAWSATCKDCGWSTSDYKPGPMRPKVEPIKPCPFCKNRDLAFFEYTFLNALDERVSVFCPKCRARGPKQFNRPDAIAAWNEGAGE